MGDPPASWDGDADGSALGSAEGDAEGSALGSAEGDAEGSALGSTEGDAEAWPSPGSFDGRALACGSELGGALEVAAAGRAASGPRLSA
jgi:hypothetical protein